MAEITLVEAVTQALAFEMAADDTVVCLGEDIGKNGGVFRATLDLVTRFGPTRVLDTPLAENMIAGLSVGMSIQGLKPVAEFQFMGFIYPAIDHIVSHATRMRNRTRGRLHCPLVFRAPFGGGIHAPEHHSESTEALFAHIPGCRVVIPSTPARAYGLLLAAIRNPDPVIFLEPKRVYRLKKQAVPDTGEALPLDTAFICRPGTDVTLVSWGAMMHETLLAAEQAAQQNIDCEVIDLATVSPFDRDTVINSVTKTGRCVIVHEACRNAGFGAEIAATLAEEALTALLAPIKRVTGFDTIMPYPKLERDYLPDTPQICDAIQAVMEYQ